MLYKISLFLLNFILTIYGAEHDAAFNSDVREKSDELILRDKLMTDIRDIKETVHYLFLRSHEQKDCVNSMASTFFDTRFDTLPKICQTTNVPRNCAAATACTRRSGIYSIRIPQISNESFYVECDAKTHEGDWTVIQKRHDGSVDFFRDWTEYKKGFGSVSGEYWIGLDRLYGLTNLMGPQELLIVMDDDKFAKYDNFVVGNEDEKYAIKSIGKYTGDAGDSLIAHLGLKFTTKDQDNDPYTNNCAVDYTGAWWYAQCHHSNLNGKFGDDVHGKGINWYTYKGHKKSLRYVKMMLRRRKF